MNIQKAILIRTRCLGSKINTPEEYLYRKEEAQDTETRSLYITTLPQGTTSTRENPSYLQVAYNVKEAITNRPPLSMAKNDLSEIGFRI